MTPGWRDRLGDLAGEVFNEAERLGLRILAGSGPQPYEIQAYRGFGTHQRMLVQGRVLESRDIGPSRDSDSAIGNLINTYKRIGSAGVPRARVRVTFDDVVREVVADDEGFFREWMEVVRPVSAEDWQRARLRLLAPLRANQPDVLAAADIRVPRETASFGVISDLDDTVIQSGVSNVLSAARALALGNARTRLPFEGVASFYRALERGGDGQRRNPIFYVSSSPWNLYDVIAEFLELKEIPAGPILLRDWDVSMNALHGEELRRYKEPLIREILTLYPSLPFILIGDTSQHDPEIYRAITHEFRGRILAIYIRDVSANAERSAAVRALADEVRAAGSSLVLAEDTSGVARHARESGWIA
ncbi:MAG TPA: phosphatase domain-containing protein [Gemmatimonadaceae bacterium]|nr:phosphatase domain-containing protein [Gemmatimonadaceae bacterium]